MHTVSHARLPNGLRVVTIQRPHIHRMVLSAYVEVGSRHETPSTNGLSHFLEHMMFRGTTARPNAHLLNDAIETLGGSLSAATHGDYTLFDLTVPPKALIPASSLLGSIFTRPVFSQIEVEKSIVREEILETLDDDHLEADPDNLARAQVFRQHPLGYPITGTLENVERFTVEDLRRHLDQFYTARNMVVAVCSPLAHKAVHKAIESGFGALRSSAAPSARTARVEQARARIHRMSSAGSQTSVRLCFPTPGGTSAVARAIEMLIRVLDDGMSTRLHHRICDELGLAYEVSGSVELFRDVGIVDVSSSVAHGSVVRLVSEILTMLADLAIEGPSKAEMEKAQHRYAFDLAALDDDPHGLNDFYGAASLWDREISVRGRQKEVLSLGQADVRRAARMVFASSRLNLVTVGTTDAASREGLQRTLRRFRERLARAETRTWLSLPPSRMDARPANVATLDSAASSF